MSSPSGGGSNPVSPGGSLKLNTVLINQKNVSALRTAQGFNVFILSSSQLKELGLVAKVKNGKPVIVHDSKDSGECKVVEAGMPTSLPHLPPTRDQHGVAGVPVKASAVKMAFPKKKSNDDASKMNIEKVNTSASPSRPDLPETTAATSMEQWRLETRHYDARFSQYWRHSLEQIGYINCPLMACNYISLTEDDMKGHYMECDGKPSISTNVCPVCMQRLRTDVDLVTHMKKSHPGDGFYKKTFPQMAVNRKYDISNKLRLLPKQRRYTKVHKVSWNISIESKGYVRCLFQNCSYLALTIEEMIQHYGICNAGGNLELLQCPYVCLFCHGSVETLDKLVTHMKISHVQEVVGKESKIYTSPKIPIPARTKIKPKTEQLDSYIITVNRNMDDKDIELISVNDVKIEPSDKAEVEGVTKVTAEVKGETEVSSEGVMMSEFEEQDASVPASEPWRYSNEIEWIEGSAPVHYATCASSPEENVQCMKTHSERRRTQSADDSSDITELEFKFETDCYQLETPKNSHVDTSLKQPQYTHTKKCWRYDKDNSEVDIGDIDVNTEDCTDSAVEEGPEISENLSPAEESLAMKSQEAPTRNSVSKSIKVSRRKKKLFPEQKDTKVKGTTEQRIDNKGQKTDSLEASKEKVLINLSTPRPMVYIPDEIEDTCSHTDVTSEQNPVDETLSSQAHVQLRKDVKNDAISRKKESLHLKIVSPKRSKTIDKTFTLASDKSSLLPTGKKDTKKNCTKGAEKECVGAEKKCVSTIWDKSKTLLSENKLSEMSEKNTAQLQLKETENLESEHKVQKSKHAFKTMYPERALSGRKLRNMKTTGDLLDQQCDIKGCSISSTYEIDMPNKTKVSANLINNSIVTSVTSDLSNTSVFHKGHASDIEDSITSKQKNSQETHIDVEKEIIQNLQNVKQNSSVVEVTEEQKIPSDISNTSGKSANNVNDGMKSEVVKITSVKGSEQSESEVTNLKGKSGESYIPVQKLRRKVQPKVTKRQFFCIQTTTGLGKIQGNIQKETNLIRQKGCSDKKAGKSDNTEKESKDEIQDSYTSDQICEEIEPQVSHSKENNKQSQNLLPKTRGKIQPKIPTRLTSISLAESELKNTCGDIYYETELKTQKSSSKEKTDQSASRTDADLNKDETQNICMKEAMGSLSQVQQLKGDKEMSQKPIKKFSGKIQPKIPERKISYGQIKLKEKQRAIQVDKELEVKEGCLEKKAAQVEERESNGEHKIPTISNENSESKETPEQNIMKIQADYFQAESAGLKKNAATDFKNILDTTNVKEVGNESSCANIYEKQEIENFRKENAEIGDKRKCREVTKIVGAQEQNVNKGNVKIQQTADCAKTTSKGKESIDASSKTDKMPGISCLEDQSSLSLICIDKTSNIQERNEKTIIISTEKQVKEKINLPVKTVHEVHSDPFITDKISEKVIQPSISTECVTEAVTNKESEKVIQHSTSKKHAAEAENKKKVQLQSIIEKSVPSIFRSDVVHKRNKEGQDNHQDNVPNQFSSVNTSQKKTDYVNTMEISADIHEDISKESSGNGIKENIQKGTLDFTRESIDIGDHQNITKEKNPKKAELSKKETIGFENQTNFPEGKNTKKVPSECQENITEEQNIKKCEVTKEKYTKEAEISIKENVTTEEQENISKETNLKKPAIVTEKKDFEELENKRASSDRSESENLTDNLLKSNCTLVKRRGTKRKIDEQASEVEKQVMESAVTNPNRGISSQAKIFKGFDGELDAQNDEKDSFTPSGRPKRKSRQKSFDDMMDIDKAIEEMSPRRTTKASTYMSDTPVQSDKDNAQSKLENNGKNIPTIQTKGKTDGVSNVTTTEDEIVVDNTESEIKLTPVKRCESKKIVKSAHKSNDSRSDKSKKEKVDEQVCIEKQTTVNPDEKCSTESEDAHNKFENNIQSNAIAHVEGMAGDKSVIQEIKAEDSVHVTEVKDIPTSPNSERATENSSTSIDSKCAKRRESKRKIFEQTVEEKKQVTGNNNHATSREGISDQSDKKSDDDTLTPSGRPKRRIRQKNYEDMMDIDEAIEEMIAARKRIKVESEASRGVSKSPPDSTKVLNNEPSDKRAEGTVEVKGEAKVSSDWVKMRVFEEQDSSAPASEPWRYSNDIKWIETSAPVHFVPYASSPEENVRCMKIHSRRSALNTRLRLLPKRRSCCKVHKISWNISVESKGYVKCLFQNCSYLALTVEEMIQHYGICNGDSELLQCPYVCRFCHGSVETREKLITHMKRSHIQEMVEKKSEIEISPKNPAFPSTKIKSQTKQMASYIITVNSSFGNIDDKNIELVPLDIGAEETVEVKGETKVSSEGIKECANRVDQGACTCPLCDMFFKPQGKHSLLSRRRFSEVNDPLQFA